MGAKSAPTKKALWICIHRVLRNHRLARLSSTTASANCSAGDAVEAMEVVKSFIVPEVRRLTTVQETAQPKEVIHSDNVLLAWPAVRACLQEFRFYDIKKVAGLAGLDVTATAYLVRKSQGGAAVALVK